MLDELESRLPDTKYIKVWKKKIKKSKTKIYLKVKLPHSHWEYRKAYNLQRLLKEYQFPIDYHKNSWFSGVVCAGKSEGTGKYEIRSFPSFLDKDIIVLKATRKGEGRGRLSELVTVVQKYVDMYRD